MVQPQHAEAIEAQLKAEVQQLLALAEEADGASLPDGMSIPGELQRREQRLAAIAEAKTKIQARAAERHACEQAGIEPLIAVGRDQHHPHFTERFTEPAPLPDAPTPVQRMTHRLKTRARRAAYALRKQSVEPAPFRTRGIIKSVMGFRQFLTRGLDNVQNKWTLVCLAWNLKPVAVLRPKSREKARKPPRLPEKASLFYQNGHQRGSTGAIQGLSPTGC